MLVVLWVSLFACAVLGAPDCAVYHRTATSWDADCGSLDLDHLPDILTQYPITNLSLRTNKIKNVTFELTNLIHLDVSFNEIESINSTLDKLTNLKSLNISYNNLRDIYPENFEQNENLDVLDISGNFLLMKNEESIYRAINRTLFGGLKQLYAKSLGLRDFPEYLFHHAYELDLLNLRNNNLSVLPKFPPSLIHLDISGNSLTELRLHSFITARKLVTLVIEDNRHLTSIHPDAFHFLKHLETLSLKGSIRLEFLPKPLFYHLPLKSLSLANCNLKTLPSYFKHQFLDLEHLDLRGNPWDCDSSLKWFNRLETPEIDGLRCAWPRNVTIADHYGTKWSHTILRNLLIILIGFVLLFFGLGIWFAYDMEKKRRLDHPYTPLGKQNSINNPIYISTVC